MSTVDSESDEWCDDEWDEPIMDEEHEDTDDAPPIDDPAADAANEEQHQRGLNEDGGIARMYEEEENAEAPPPRLVGMLEGLRPIASTPEGMPTFMVMDVVMQRSKDRRRTEAVLFGRERCGGSVCVTVTGWQPYLLIRAPSGWADTPSQCAQVRELLEERVALYLQQTNDYAPRISARAPPPNIYSVASLHDHKSIFGYTADASIFLKIEVAYPQLVNALRDVLVGYPKPKLDADGISGFDRVPGVVVTSRCTLEDGQSETFNSNLDAVLQFMVDAGLWGCQWCTLSNRATEEDNLKKSTCTYELRAQLEDLVVISLDDLAPLRVLSFDIEAAGRRGVFPQPEIDPVIQIALHFNVLGGTTKLKPILLSLRECDPIDGALVLSFESEAALLCAFRDIVVAFDTDVFSGYNVCGFDFGYLQNRAEALLIGQDDGERFDSITRLHSGRMVIRETEFFSAQMGKQRRVKVTIPGRAVLDMLMAIRNNQSYRLEKYTLDAVSAYFLGDHKNDVHFTQITPMWLKDSASRRELGEYCLQDAKLPIDLMQKLDALTQTIEMARAVGVPFDYVMQRGQMIRNASLLLRSAKGRRFVFPNKTPFSRQSAPPPASVGRTNRYQGATVLDPICGIHNMVGVVDFSAMYPSIMRAHNICASTIILDEKNPLRDADDMLRVCGHVFVSEKHVKGLIPEVVELLQHCRTKAKKAYAEATDPLQKKVAKARELAYKVAGNGVYGALGSELSLIPLMAIAETVTAIGRMDIMLVKKTAERMYPNALVVYGDTDSVFVRHALPKGAPAVDAVSEASRLTIALADEVNAMMKAPKKLEFEKVYGTMLLLSKKRYCGLLYAPNHDWGTPPPIDIKGLQSQRRDGCPLVRDIVRDCLTSILHTGGSEDAASMVRQRLVELMDDTLPLETYAIQKTLRKSMQDVCHPMYPDEVSSVRDKLHAAGSHSESRGAPQLTYAEQDDAIRLKIPLKWRLRIRLPHVMLAYRMREADVGSAPVSGDIIRYIVTNNGRGNKIWEKVETLEDVRKKSIAVDRKYYLKSLYTPMINLFLPIVRQRRAEKNEEHDEKNTLAETDRMLFDITKRRPWRHDAALRSACLANSPLMMAFARQRAAPPAKKAKVSCDF